MVKIKISAIVIILSLFAVPLSAGEQNAEQNNADSVTIQVRVPKVVITENDKMTYDTTLGWISDFIFLNKEYKLYNIKSDLKFIEKLFKISSNKAYKYFLLIKKFRVIAYNKNKVIWSKKYYNFIAKKAVNAFNDFLAESKANRDKIAKVIMEQRRMELEAKLLKERIKERRERRERERQRLERQRVKNLWKNKSLTYLGLFFSGNWIVLEDGYREQKETCTAGKNIYEAGIEFIHFFKNPVSSFNIGLVFDVSYSYLIYGAVGHMAGGEDFSLNYLNFNLGFIFKMARAPYVSNFYLKLQFTIGLRLDKNNVFNIYYQRSSFTVLDRITMAPVSIGGIFSLGYLYTPYNSKFCFYIGWVFNLKKIASEKLNVIGSDHYNRYIEFFTGGEIGILFNI